jgi:hypothetical protein
VRFFGGRSSLKVRCSFFGILEGGKGCGVASLGNDVMEIEDVMREARDFDGTMCVWCE